MAHGRTDSIRSQSPPRRSRWAWRAACTSAAFASVVAILVVAAPFSSASPIVKLVAPFSGTPFATISLYHQGCGGNKLTHGPYFSTSNGQAHVNQESYASKCTGSSPVLSIFQAITNSGINSTPFSPSSSIASAHVKVHWMLTYTFFISATLGNSSQTTYTFFSVGVLATIYDKTTGTTYHPTNMYYNNGTVSNVNGSSLMNVHKLPVELFFNLSLSSAHSYVYNTSVRLITTVDTIGPGSSAFAVLYFYNPPYLERATLNWVSY